MANTRARFNVQGMTTQPQLLTGGPITTNYANIGPNGEDYRFVQPNPNQQQAGPTTPQSTSPSCPGCGSPMRLNTVKKENANKGRQFLACTSSCRRAGAFMWLDKPDSSPQKKPQNNKPQSPKQQFPPQNNTNNNTQSNSNNLAIQLLIDQMDGLIALTKKIETDQRKLMEAVNLLLDLNKIHPSSHETASSPNTISGEPMDSQVSDTEEVIPISQKRLK